MNGTSFFKVIRKEPHDLRMGRRDGRDAAHGAKAAGLPAVRLRRRGPGSAPRTELGLDSARGVGARLVVFIAAARCSQRRWRLASDLPQAA